MSAISAIYRLDNSPVSESEIAIQLEEMRHRGDDGIGVLVDGHVGLGHRMRRTTPESLIEELPRKHHNQATMITCDARIDNRSELIRSLNIRKQVEELTDSEIILLAYEKWGIDCFPKLIGDFAVVIWDPSEDRLVCARDSMGIKHFYYLHRPGKIFALASEAKGLLCLPGVDRAVDQKFIGDQLILNFHDKERTPYKGIFRLPGNSVMCVGPRGISIRQYWSPKVADAERRVSFDEYESEFRDVFTEAVRCRTRAVSRVGAFLSGGLDSSSISCVASKFLPGDSGSRLETFSAIFPSIAEVDRRIDEREFIEAVVNSIDCESNLIVADAFSPLTDLERMQNLADHPIGVPNVFMDWAIFKTARRRGADVILSGFDGDSAVSYGYEALPELVRQGKWIRLIRDSRALVRNMPHRQHTFRKLVWNQGIRPAIPDSVRQIWRVARGRPRRPQPDDRLPSVNAFCLEVLNPEFVKEAAPESRYFELREKEYPSGVDEVTESWNALRNGLFAFALETFEKLGAGSGIEPRFPFFDRRLIDLCLRMPFEQRLAGGWTRSILRRAMTGIIPPKVQWRRDKANIGLSFKLNLLKFGRSEIEDAILADRSLLQPFFRMDKLESAWRTYEKNPLGRDGEPMLLLMAVHLSNWLRSERSGR